MNLLLSLSNPAKHGSVGFGYFSFAANRPLAFPGPREFEEELDYEAIQGEWRDPVILSVALRLIGAGIHSGAADKEGGGVLAPPVTRPIGRPNYQAVARTKVFDFRDRIIGPRGAACAG